jgi:hypothetical protein
MKLVIFVVMIICTLSAYAGQAKPVQSHSKAPVMSQELTVKILKISLRMANERLALEHSKEWQALKADEPVQVEVMKEWAAFCGTEHQPGENTTGDLQCIDKPVTTPADTNRPNTNPETPRGTDPNAKTN